MIWEIILRKEMSIDPSHRLFFQEEDPREDFRFGKDYSIRRQTE